MNNVIIPAILIIKFSVLTTVFFMNIKVYLIPPKILHISISFFHFRGEVFVDGPLDYESVTGYELKILAFTDTVSKNHLYLSLNTLYMVLVKFWPDY